MSLISIDLYNQNIFVRLAEVVHGFANVEIFELGTGFSREFPDTKIISYEPDRNMFVVERLGGVVVVGRDQPEIQWIQDNLTHIVEAAHEDIEKGAPSTLVNDVRIGRLFATDWLVVRHNEQSLMGVATTLSAEQFQELHNYRQALRNIPKSDLLLDGMQYSWPDIPSFVPSL